MKSTGLPRYTFRVVRCEASQRLDGSPGDGEFEWEVVPLRRSGQMLAVGGMLTWRSNEGRAEVQVIGHVLDYPLDSAASVDDLVSSLESVWFVENLYDLARRTATAQAALCDLVPDLPLRSPDHKLDRDFFMVEPSDSE